MECPNCKKELADNAKSCPECGYDFTEKQNQKNVTIGCISLISIFISLLIILLIAFASGESEQNTTSKWTQEDIQEADDFITSIEATGLIKERKNACSDGSKGCYYFVIDENLWNNAANYETKQQLQIASEIYTSSQSDYRFYEGIGYMSGKTLYDIWGIK